MVSVAKAITSWDMYAAGLNQDNLYYGLGLIAIGGLLDLGATGIRGLKAAGNTANEWKAVASMIKETADTGMLKAGKEAAEGSLGKSGGLFTDGAVSKYPEASKYQFNATTNPGPLAEMGRVRAEPIRNFYGGYYNKTILSDDIFVYRAGDINDAKGQWFTFEKPQSIVHVRIDSAVKEQWIDPLTGSLPSTSYINTTYQYKIPKGTTIFEGPVGYQSGINMGGLENIQIYIPKQNQKNIELIFFDLIK